MVASTNGCPVGFNQPGRSRPRAERKGDGTHHRAQGEGQSSGEISGDLWKIYFSS